MKILSLLIVMLFVGEGCAGQTLADRKTVLIAYNASSRGLYRNIVVENQKATIAKSRGEQPVVTKITDADWKIVVTEFQKIALDSLSKLKAPTKKRFYDGAASANLKIIYKRKTYESQSFDHGFPPEKIKKLVTILVLLTEK